MSDAARMESGCRTVGQLKAGKDRKCQEEIFYFHWSGPPQWCHKYILHYVVILGCREIGRTSKKNETPGGSGGSAPYDGSLSAV
jgi:hypothetical protein